MANLPMDARLSYGVATRQHTYNGKIINVANKELMPRDGEIALWDDRYSIIWFHRINSSSLMQEENGKYGRSRSAAKESLNIDLVVWAAVRYRHLGELKTITQFQLYRMLTGILLFQTTAEVTGSDFDMPAIGRSEFIEHRIHKECLLLRIRYDITQMLTRDCLCSPDPNECTT